MIIYGMEDMLIDIQNIKNLSSIKLGSFFFIRDKSGKMELVPLLTITYDGGKTLSLSSKEKYFDSFVKKVTEVYNDEKDNIVEDSLTDPFRLRSHILIDEHTKDVLEKGSLRNINQAYTFYDNKFSYNNSLLFQKDEFKLLFPIIKYHLEDLFRKTSTNVKIFDTIQGYRDNFLLKASVDGLEKVINVSYFKENENKYILEIGGLFNECNSFAMSIEFKKDRIVVIINNQKYELVCEYTYLTNNEKIKQIINISKGNRRVVYENKDLEQCENNIPNITDLDSKSDFIWYKLPWNAMYGINNDVTTLSDEEKMVQTYSMYVCTFQKSFMKKENYSKTYKRNSTVALSTNEVVIDDMLKNTICICVIDNENIFVIETSFLDSRYPNGYYLEKLKDKYFYHVVRSENGVSDIMLSNGINVTKDDILVNSDLRDEGIILSLTKGDK